MRARKMAIEAKPERSIEVENKNIRQNYLMRGDTTPLGWLADRKILAVPAHLKPKRVRERKGKAPKPSDKLGASLSGAATTPELSSESESDVEPRSNLSTGASPAPTTSGGAKVKKEDGDTNDSLWRW